MSNALVRLARPSDLDPLARMRAALWPESSAEEHARELATILAGKFLSHFPLAIFVCQAPDGRLTGFLEVGLRSYADGCDPSRPPGYVEGWYVAPACRRKGIAAELLRAAEDWARSVGCREMASDAELENEVSQRAHQALGFEIVGRNVLYRKTLGYGASAGTKPADETSRRES